MKKQNLKNLPFLIFSVLCLVTLAVFLLSFTRLRSENKKHLGKDSMYTDASRINKRSFETLEDAAASPVGYRILAANFPEFELTDPESAKKGDKPSDETALIYMHKYSDKAGKLIEKLSEDKNITMIRLNDLLNTEYDYEGAAALLLEEKSALNREQLKMIYLNDRYITSDFVSGPLTYQEWLALTTSVEHIYPDVFAVLSPAFSTLDFLNGMSSEDLLTKKYTPEEFAELFGFDSSRIVELASLYVSKETILPLLTLPELSDFLINEVVDNPSFAEYMDKPMKNDIRRFSKFVDKDVLTMELTAAELSSLLDTDETTVLAVIKLKNGLLAKTSDLSSLVDFLLENSEESIISSFLDAKTVEDLNLLKNIISNVISDRPLSYEDTAELFGFPKDLTQKLYEYKLSLDEAANTEDLPSLTIPQFLSFLSERAPSDPKANMPDGSKENLLYRAYYNAVSCMYAEETDSSELAEALVTLKNMLSASSTDAGEVKKAFEGLKYLLFVRDNTNPDTKYTLSQLSELAIPSNAELFFDTASADYYASLQASIKSIGNVFESDSYSKIFLVFDSSMSEKEKSKEIKKYYDMIKEDYSGTKVLLLNEGLLNIELKEKYLNRTIISAVLFVILLFIWLNTFDYIKDKPVLPPR